MIYMGIYNNVYIGHVETVNLEAYEKEKLIESKVVVLKQSGFDDKNQMPKYKPLRKYKEYYKINNIEPLNGIVNDKIINLAIKKTGKQEVKTLRKVI